MELSLRHNWERMVHEHIQVNGRITHCVQAGNKSNQAILFLHGYPQNWQAFEKVMDFLKDDYFVLAIDLPGIGESEAIPSTDKKTIAAHVHQLMLQLQLNNVVVVGHDVGGMVAFSLLKHFPGNIGKAVLMNTAIPGVEPWEAVKRNPYIWHFAFYAVPHLPEALIDGKQNILFDYFYDTLCADKQSIDEESRKRYVEAYNTPDGLKTGLGWYRAFRQDEKDNAGVTAIDIPVLYLRGDKDPGKPDDYMAGLKKSGIQNLTLQVVSHSGHFSADEAPAEVAEAINDFCRT